MLAASLEELDLLIHIATDRPADHTPEEIRLAITASIDRAEQAAYAEGFRDGMQHK